MRPLHHDLSAFVEAAKRAPLVRAHRHGQTIEVLPVLVVSDVETATPDADHDCVALLIDALRHEFGARAAEAACREAKLQGRSKPCLSSRKVQQAVACASSAWALEQGQRFVWRTRHSARLRGADFVAACQRCGLDPAALPPALCEAIDLQMQQHFEAGAIDTSENCSEQLLALLTRSVH
jgi:hypothetical protein